MVKSTEKQLKKQVNSSKLQQVNPRVAGIDIGATMLMVCIGHADCTQEVREFGTFTHDLRKIVKWFKECDIRSVAMEATGVYWIPPYDIFAENGIEVILVNPHHFKSLPGRKTDVIDCQWLQQLHSYGLLRASFRPNDDGVVIRTLVRHRSRLVELASACTLRAHKALTMMNIQLNQVLSDVTGSTGMQIMRAIIAGERNPRVLAQYRNSRCKRNEDEIALALEGNFRAEIVFALKDSIEIYDFLQQKILSCNSEIQQKIASLPEIHCATEPEEETKQNKKRAAKADQNNYGFDVDTELKKRLGVAITDIPGIGSNAAIKIISEIGTDMDRWPTVSHFTSWLGLCPNNKISGGKILSSSTKACANKAAQAFRLAAFSLHRSNNALGGYYRRIRARSGAPKAITALAHKMARILYAMIKSKQSYKEMGLEAFEHQYAQRKLAALKKAAAEAGFTLSPVQ